MEQRGLFEAHRRNASPESQLDIVACYLAVAEDHHLLSTSMRSCESAGAEVD
jgi:hypothetical protein